MKKVSLLLVLMIALSSVTALAANEKKRGWFGREAREERKELRKEQKQDNQALRQQMQNLTPEQRLAALQAQRRKQFDESKALVQQQHAARMQELDKRLAQNPQLTAEQKSQIKARAEKQHQENVTFRQQQFDKTQAYVSKIASDPSLTDEQRRAAIESYRKSQVEAAKSHLQAQRSESKDLRTAIKS